MWVRALVCERDYGLRCACLQDHHITDIVTKLYCMYCAARFIAIAKCLFSFPGSPARRRSRKTPKYPQRKTNTYIPERAWYQARYQASLLRHARSRAWGRCTKDPGKSNTARLNVKKAVCLYVKVTARHREQFQVAVSSPRSSARSTDAHTPKTKNRRDIPQSSSKHPGRQDKPGPSDS